jgi:3-oxoadipate enol-lactonase
MPVVQVGGVALHHRLDGPAAAPVLLLSGSLGTDLGLWEPLLPTLAERFRVLRHDHRGHGRSTAPPGPCTVELLARDVLTLLDALGIARAHLCGLSLGGMVGQWLGAHAPDRVGALVLCNTSARMARPAAYDARIAAVRAGGLAAVAEEVLAAWLTPAFRAARPAEAERARRMLLATPAEGYAAACTAVRDADLREALPRVRARTLVVAGAADAATPPADGRYLAEHITGARYREVAAAHLSALEAPAALAEAILGHLSEGG